MGQGHHSRPDLAAAHVAAYLVDLLLGLLCEGPRVAESGGSSCEGASVLSCGSCEPAGAGCWQLAPEGACPRSALVLAVLASCLAVLLNRAALAAGDL